MIGEIPDLIAKRAELAPRAVALEEAATGRTRTYAELDARATAAAAMLDGHGVGAGDRVAILCRNRIEYFELLFACARLGAIFVPLNWRMPPGELDGLIADCAPVLLFHGVGDAEAVSRLAAAIPAICLDDDSERLLVEVAPAHTRRHWQAEATWYLIYTSGTTGQPKGVVYTYRMALANYVNIGSATGLRGSDTTVAFLPNFHTAGINLHALPVLIAGGRVIVLESFDADAIVALLAAERLDTLFAVPTVYQALLDHPRFAAAPLDAIRHWGCGGAPLPDALVERYPQAQRAREIHLHAAPDVDADVGLADVGKDLAIDPPTRRAVELDPADRHRRLEQSVEHVGPQLRRQLVEVLARMGVFELEADNEQSDAAGDPGERSI